MTSSSAFPALLARHLTQHPLTLALIGSRGGLSPAWQPTRPYLQIIGFEPDHRSHQHLPQTNAERHFNVGLSDHRGTETLYLTRKPGLSSTLKPNGHLIKHLAISDQFTLTGTTSIQVDTLDNVVRAQRIKTIDVIQLDTQGSELRILRGAQTLLANQVLGVEVEVEFAPLYQQQPLFAEIDSFLRQFDFELFDLRPYYFKRRAGVSLGGPKGQLIAADALYLRTPPHILPLIVAATSSTQQRAKIAAALLLYSTYGYLDVAQELLKTAAAYLTSAEQATVSQFLTRQGSTSRLRAFPGHGRLARLLQRWAQTLQPASPTGELRGNLGNTIADR